MKPANELHTRTHERTASTEMFPPLEELNRPHASTDQAAFYLLRRPQTLRLWASRGDGPITPLRVNGRLAWPVAEIRALLGVTK